MSRIFTLAGFFAILLLISGTGWAQRTCASHEVYEEMAASDPQFVINQQKLEEITRKFIESGGAAAVPLTQSGSIEYRIPVVFHLVYRTPEERISKARLLAQLQVLNEDFQQLNPDLLTEFIPAAYRGLVTNVKIEFCLAQQDPQGNFFEGVNERQTTVTAFSSNNAVKYYSQGGLDAWPRDEYLNFWVCNLGSSLLGYAQFPGGNAATDGVVCHYKSVGSRDVPGEYGSQFGWGRTATHEIGHWLNLRHIWGDGRCRTDEVGDTPFHPGSNGGCPSNTLTTSCNQNPGAPMMWMNYMDYTNDRCMYMFTHGQRDRMWAVMQSGQPRFAVTQSKRCDPPGTTCLSPTSLSSSGLTQTSANLSWVSVSGANSYTVQYRTPVGSGTWVQSNSNTNSVALSGLTAGTTYEWQVRTNCSSSSSAFSSSAQFTTQQPTVTCNPPSASSLNVTNITLNSATLSWTNSGEAISARLEYRENGAPTWNVIDPATSPVTLPGLSPSTTYNWRVQSNCAGGATSTFATGANFTTLSDPGACTDAFEPNNTSVAAYSIQPFLGTAISAKICSPNDVDWYTFTNTNQTRAVRVTLGNASGAGYNYNMRLYRPNGQLAGTTSGTGAPKELSITGNPTGAYRVEVFSSSGSSETAPYTLLAEIGSSFREADRLIVIGSDIRLFPNPASSEVLIQFGNDWSGTHAEVVMTDLMGRRVQRHVVQASGTQALDVNALSTGIYLMQVSNGSLNQVQKVMIRK